MASRRDGFWGIKIPGFLCPTGTYGMYGKHTEAKCQVFLKSSETWQRKVWIIVTLFTDKMMLDNKSASRELILYVNENWLYTMKIW